MAYIKDEQIMNHGFTMSAVILSYNSNVKIDMRENEGCDYSNVSGKKLLWDLWILQKWSEQTIVQLKDCITWKPLALKCGMFTS